MKGRRLQGTAVILLLIRRDGTTGPVALRRSSGDPTLDAAFLEVARQLRFHPALFNRVPVTIAIEMPLSVV